MTSEHRLAEEGRCAALTSALLTAPALGIKKLYQFQSEILTYLIHGRSAPASGKELELQGAGGLSTYSVNANDIMVYSPTGFGKTLTYVAPILHFLKDRPRVGDSFTASSRPDGVAALVLVPTKELAFQVQAVFQEALGDDRCAAITGELQLLEEIRALQSTSCGPAGPDVVVCVAHRFALHAEPTARYSNSCRWNCLRYLVVDEADRLLADNVGKWLVALRHVTAEADELRGAKTAAAVHKPHILTQYWLDRTGDEPRSSVSALPLLRPVTLQKIICTATDVKSFKGMRSLRLLEPLCARAHLEKDRLKQRVAIVPAGESVESVLISSLKHIMAAKASNQCLVFCRQRSGVVKVQKAVKAAGLEGEMLFGSDSTKRRRQTFERFREGKIRLLISSDVTARGLDIPSVTHVVQYGLPKNADEYIHRVGRTARCGRKGETLLIIGVKDSQKFLKMKQTILDLRPTSTIKHVQ